MKLIVGLGNPGTQYELTRHNIGKRSVTALAATERLSFQSDSAMKASMCSWSTPTNKILIAYPNSYMNLSGEAVRLICDYYKIQTDLDLLVITDDVALPMGTIRMRSVGSTGGHNGLASIEQALGHSKYHRMKIGVGEHINACDSINDFLRGRPLEDFVLEKFNSEDEKKAGDILALSAKAARIWAEGSFTEAANLVNVKRTSD